MHMSAGQTLAGKALVSPEELRAQLKGLSDKRVLALLVVDLLDCSGSFLNHVRDLVGKNPIMLVGTKVKRFFRSWVQVVVNPSQT